MLIGRSKECLYTGYIVELLSMTNAREPGYSPFSDAPAFLDEETVLPVSIPADELQHLTERHDSAPSGQTEAHPSFFSTVMRFVWQGGSPGDAWLHMTAAQVGTCAVLFCLVAVQLLTTVYIMLHQVGQVILTLPYTMAQTGMLFGILLQLAYAVMASWTAYLMNTLYMEYDNRQQRAKALSTHPAHPNNR